MEVHKGPRPHHSLNKPTAFDGMLWEDDGGCCLYVCRDAQNDVWERLSSIWHIHVPTGAALLWPDENPLPAGWIQLGNQELHLGPLGFKIIKRA